MKKRKTIKDKKFIDELKNKYAKIPIWTDEIVCKGEVVMQKEIWTNKQQAYLDDKFNAIDQRFEKLENQVKQNAQGIKQNAQGIKQNAEAIQRNAEAIQRNADGINQIIQILARSGMR